MELALTSHKVVRDSHGRILPGQPSLNPEGRPSGSISIKDKIRQYLETHPDAVEQVVGHFVHNNRNLMWQMLEGSPQTKSDITSGGKPLSVTVLSFDEYSNSPQSETD